MNLQFLEKVISLIHFDFFSAKYGSLTLSIQIFKVIYQKRKIFKLVKYSLSVKNNHNFGSWISQNGNFYINLVLGTFSLFFFKNMVIWHYLSKFLKTLI